MTNTSEVSVCWASSLQVMPMPCVWARDSQMADNTLIGRAGVDSGKPEQLPKRGRLGACWEKTSHFHLGLSCAPRVSRWPCLPDGFLLYTAIRQQCSCVELGPDACNQAAERLISPQCEGPEWARPALGCLQVTSWNEMPASSASFQIATAGPQQGYARKDRWPPAVLQGSFPGVAA